jgi:hypothetical protein
MVKGIEKFKEHFAGFEDKYILIGGSACKAGGRRDRKERRYKETQERPFPAVYNPFTRPAN